MLIDPMTPAKLPDRILDPMDGISEVLFGLIMALTFTCTLGVAIADNIQVRTMLIGALGCNLAWGIIDGGVCLMARLNERGRALISWHAVRPVARLPQLECWRDLHPQELKSRPPLL